MLRGQVLLGQLDELVLVDSLDGVPHGQVSRVFMGPA